MSGQVVLIAGATGQDGRLAVSLCHFFGFRVVAIGRSERPSPQLLAEGDNEIAYYATDYSEVDLIALLDAIKPTVILNFAGQSLVSKSWSIVSETITSHAVVVGNFLSAVLKLDLDCYFLNACSSEIFGELSGSSNLGLIRRQLTPYGVAQNAGFELVRMFREQKGLRATNAVLYNHESVYRSPRFVFGKIVSYAYKCCLAKQEQLRLGDLAISRDWGYAPEYVYICLMMAVNDMQTDIPICTGNGLSLSEVVDTAFSFFNLDASNFVVSDPSFYREREAKSIVGDHSILKEQLAVGPQIQGQELVTKICADYCLAVESKEWVNWASIASGLRKIV